MSDGLYTLVLRFANIAGAAALGILTARLLGPAGKGIYALPMIQAALVATTFGGLTSATSYYILNSEAGPRAALLAALRASVLFVLAAALGVLAIGAIGHAWWAVPAAIASLPAAAVINVVTGYVIGIKRVRMATTLTIAGTLCNFAFAAIGLLLVARTPFVAIAAWIASLWLVAALALVIALNHARRASPSNTSVPGGSFVRLAGKVGAVSVVTLLNYRADLYIVALFLSPAALGLYSVAVSAAESLLVPTQIAALVTSPHIGSLPPLEAGRLAARCVRNNLLIATIVCAILFAFAPLFVSFLYGAAFLPLVPALRILLAGVVILSLGSPVSAYYTLKLAKPELMLSLAAFSAFLCIALSLVLIPRFGLAGAAEASTAAYVIGQSLGLLYFSRSTGIGWRTILIPTLDDLWQYRSFIARVLHDRRIAPSAIAARIE